MKRFLIWIQQHPLVVIFLLAFTARIVGNTYTPASPYWEEAALGYDAYSILKTAHDYHGNFLPLVAFPSFGDYKPSLYFYTLVPSIAVFGLNLFAVRLPAVLASAITAALLFAIVRRWSSARAACWAALLYTVQPWAWQVGRVGFEVNLSVMLLIAGVWALDHAVEWQKSKKENRHFWFWSLGSATLFILSMYAYHAARLLAPLFATSFFLLNAPWKKPLWDWKKLPLWRWLPAGLLAIILVSPILLALKTPAVQQRLNETSIFSDTRPATQSEEWRTLAGNGPLAHILFSQRLFWTRLIEENYLIHFSPHFLFWRGDTNPRHSSQYFGMLYPWEILSVTLGLAAGWRLFKQRRHYFSLLVLTLLSPAAAALTTATPHGLRALPLASWLAVWSALGIVILIEDGAAQLRVWLPKIKKTTIETWLTASLGVVTLGSFAVLAYYMAFQYRTLEANEWQGGYQEIIATMRRLQQPGEKLFLSRAYGRPAMYVWFYEKTDPRLVQAEALHVPLDQGEFLQFQEWSFFTGQLSSGGLIGSLEADMPTGKTPLARIPLGDGTRYWAIYR